MKQGALLIFLFPVRPDIDRGAFRNPEIRPQELVDGGRNSWGDRAVGRQAGDQPLPGSRRAVDGNGVDIDPVFGGDNFGRSDGRRHGWNAGDISAFAEMAVHGVLGQGEGT